MSYPDFDPYCYDELEPYPDLDPYPDRTAIPSCDADCRVLIDQAVQSLIILRGGSTRDPGAQISALASLAVEANDRIPDAVWSARTDHRYSWDKIAERLALASANAARRRYSSYVKLRSELAMNEQHCRSIDTQSCRPMCK